MEGTVKTDAAIIDRTSADPQAAVYLQNGNSPINGCP